MSVKSVPKNKIGGYPPNRFNRRSNSVIGVQHIVVLRYYRTGPTKLSYDLLVSPVRFNHISNHYEFSDLLNTIFALLVFLLVIPMEVVDKMEHHVVGQGAIPCFGTPLCVDCILRAGELVQNVERFKTGYELALQQRLADGGVDYEVVGIEGGTSIASAAAHPRIGT